MILLYLLFRDDSKELLSPVLQLHQRYTLIEHNKYVCSRHMDLASYQTAIHRLFLDDVLHYGVCDVVYVSHIVGTVQLLGLRINDFT